MHKDAHHMIRVVLINEATRGIELDFGLDIDD